MPAARAAPICCCRSSRGDPRLLCGGGGVVAREPLGPIARITSASGSGSGSRVEGSRQNGSRPPSFVLSAATRSAAVKKRAPVVPRERFLLAVRSGINRRIQGLSAYPSPAGGGWRRVGGVGWGLVEQINRKIPGLAFGLVPVYRNSPSRLAFAALRRSTLPRCTAEGCAIGINRGKHSSPSKIYANFAGSSGNGSMSRRRQVGSPPRAHRMTISTASWACLATASSIAMIFLLRAPSGRPGCRFVRAGISLHPPWV